MCTLKRDTMLSLKFISVCVSNIGENDENGEKELDKFLKEGGSLCRK